MAYAVINKTGCLERKGHPQIRFDMFMEQDDKGYERTYVQVPVIPEGGYPNKVDKQGNPVDQKDYDKWYASLPRIWQLNPFHSHFIGYYPHDFTDSQLKLDMDFHLANFYKTFNEAPLDKDGQMPNGYMRHGYAVEKRIIPVNYAKTLETVEYQIVKNQVVSRLNRLDEFKQTPIILNDGKFYPATEIDVGTAAIDRVGAAGLVGTYVNPDNSANDTGALDTAEIYGKSSGMANVKVGTLYGSGTSYTSRDYTTIGSVSAGYNSFTGISIDVETGDFLGLYTSLGYIADSGSGTGYYRCAGDQFGTGAQTYTLNSGHTVSLYATGETVAEVTHFLSLLGVGG
jgi:hypothetical protein